MKNTKKYKVEVYELHSMTWIVEASSIKDAIQAAMDGDGETGEFEFVETATKYGKNGIRSVKLPDGKQLFYNEMEDV